jgi:hypothetical protein
MADSQDEAARLLRRSAWVLRAAAVLLAVSGIASIGDWGAAWPWFAGAIGLVALSFVLSGYGRQA